MFFALMPFGADKNLRAFMVLQGHERLLVNCYILILYALPFPKSSLLYYWRLAGLKRIGGSLESAWIPAYLYFGTYWTDSDWLPGNGC